MTGEKKIKIVHLNHDPVVLRIEKKVTDTFGIVAFQTVGEFALARGRNEVDAKAWDSWYEVDGATNPLMTGGSIIVEEPKEEPDGEPEKQSVVGAAAAGPERGESEPGADVGGPSQGGEDGAEAGSPGGADAEQGEVRDGGIEAPAEP